MPSIINATLSNGLVQSADTSGVIELQTNGTTVATVNTSNNVQFRSAISVGNATPTTSGAGITFPATQSASTDANTLDDYEEGTWTPTVFGSSTAGTTTFNNRAGYYTKIGRMVFATFEASYSAATGTGTLRIGGLPFTATTGPCVGSFMFSNLDAPNQGSYVIYTESGISHMQIYSSTDNAALQAFQLSNESAEFYGTITYFA